MPRPARGRASTKRRPDRRPGPGAHPPAVAPERLRPAADSGFDAAAKAGEAKHKKPAATARKGLKYKFASTFEILAESTVVDIVAQLEAERAAEVAKLQVSPKIQFLNAFDTKAPATAAKPATEASCEALLGKPKK